MPRALRALADNCGGALRAAGVNGAKQPSPLKPAALRATRPETRRQRENHGLVAPNFVLSPLKPAALRATDARKMVGVFFFHGSGYIVGYRFRAASFATVGPDVALNAAGIKGTPWFTTLCQELVSNCIDWPRFVSSPAGINHALLLVETIDCVEP